MAWPCSKPPCSKSSFAVVRRDRHQAARQHAALRQTREQSRQLHVHERDLLVVRRGDECAVPLRHAPGMAGEPACAGDREREVRVHAPGEATALAGRGVVVHVRIEEVHDQEEALVGMAIHVVEAAIHHAVGAQDLPVGGRRVVVLVEAARDAEVGGQRRIAHDRAGGVALLPEALRQGAAVALEVGGDGGEVPLVGVADDPAGAVPRRDLPGVDRGEAGQRPGRAGEGAVVDPRARQPRRELRMPPARHPRIEQPVGAQRVHHDEHQGFRSALGSRTADRAEAQRDAGDSQGDGQATPHDRPRMPQGGAAGYGVAALRVRRSAPRARAGGP